MFIKNGILFLLKNAFNCTSKKGIHLYCYRSLSGFHCRYLSSKFNNGYSTSINDADKSKSTKKIKPIDIIADLDFVDDKKQEAIDSAKHLSKDMSSSEKFIKLMRCEGDFDKNGVINMLENYNFFKQKFIRVKKHKDAIKSSPEFKKFLKALEENILKLEGHHLVSALSCINWFGVSKDADLYTSIMLQIIERIDDIKLNDAVLLLAIVRTINYEHNYEEDVLMNEMSEELKLKIKNKLTKKINHLTELELISVLKFLRNYNYEWPDEALIKLLNSCFNSTTFWEKVVAFGSVYVVISFLKDEYKKKEFQLKVLLKLFDHMLKDKTQSPNNFLNFAQEYAVLVWNEREEFDEKMYNSVMDSVMNKKITLGPFIDVVSVTNLTRYIRTDVLEVIKEMVFRDMIYNNLHRHFPSRNEYFKFYRNCLDIMICSEFQMSQVEWLRMKSYLNVHLILTDVNEWKDANETTSLRLALSLAALGVFPNKVLEHLFQNIHLEEESYSWKNYELVLLNQAAALLNPNHPKKFLKDIPPSLATNNNGKKINITKSETFVDDIKETLEKIKIPCLINLFTKFGHNISFVVAVNKENQFFEFKISDGDIYLESVSVPEGYKLILVLPVMNDSYSRNWLTLRTSAVVTIKSLEKMGYEIAPILYDKWFNLSSEGKKKFLLTRFKQAER